MPRRCSTTSFESAADQIAIRLVEIAHSPLESGFGGHHVHTWAAVHFGNGQHQRVEGRDVVAHDGLQAQNNTGERFDGPGALCTGNRRGCLRRRVSGISRSRPSSAQRRWPAGRAHSWGLLCVPIMASTSSTSPASIMARAPWPVSPLGWNRILIEPANLSRCSASQKAAPSRTGHVQVVAAAVHHAFIDGARTQSGVFHDGQAVDAGARNDTRPGPASPRMSPKHPVPAGCAGSRCRAP